MNHNNNVIPLEADMYILDLKFAIGVSNTSNYFKHL